MSFKLTAKQASIIQDDFSLNRSYFLDRWLDSTNFNNVQIGCSNPTTLRSLVSKKVITGEASKPHYYTDEFLQWVLDDNLNDSNPTIKAEKMIEQYKAMVNPVILISVDMNTGKKQAKVINSNGSVIVPYEPYYLLALAIMSQGRADARVILPLDLSYCIPKHVGNMIFQFEIKEKDYLTFKNQICDLICDILTVYNHRKKRDFCGFKNKAKLVIDRV